MDLTYRKQFVEIDTNRSNTLNSLNCSVIQGSKLSGILYTIYTNEIPLLHTLMHKEIFTKLTGQQSTTSKSIEHNTINFVDNSTNIIRTKNPSEIQEYLNKFYLLLEAV